MQCLFPAADNYPDRCFEFFFRGVLELPKDIIAVFKKSRIVMTGFLKRRILCYFSLNHRDFCVSVIGVDHEDLPDFGPDHKLLRSAGSERNVNRSIAFTGGEADSLRPVGAGFAAAGLASLHRISRRVGWYLPCYWSALNCLLHPHRLKS